MFYSDFPSISYEFGTFRSITIDKRLSIEEQREHSIHELCHILRHSGQQFQMVSAFWDLQEPQAANFQLYATIPFYLIKEMELPTTDNEIVQYLAQEFRVRTGLAQKRWEQIKRHC